MTIEERWPGAVEYTGKVPVSWLCESVHNNGHYYFHLWRTPEGKRCYTRQPVQKKPDWPRYDFRKENGMEFARKRWRRKPYEAR